MAYQISRSSSPSPDHTYPIIPSSSENEKDEAISETKEPEFLIPGLKDNNAAYMILEKAAQGGMDIRTLCRMLKVNRAWRNAVDSIIVRPCWYRLEEKTKEANTGVSLRLHSIFMKLAAEDLIIKIFDESVTNSASSSSAAEEDLSEEGSLPNTAQSLELSYFSRFSALTDDLRNSGVPIPKECVVLGFDYLAYEEKQREFDTALETIWTRIQQGIDFEGALIPANAKAIRAWLGNPLNAEKIAGVTNLDLSEMDLRVLPPEIGAFSQLTRLTLAKNRLTTLPPEIAKLTLLNWLALNENQLTTFPLEIYTLSQLTELSLGQNLIETLPPEIGNFPLLRRLALYENQITTLPAQIGDLSQLTQLRLSENLIEILPPEIGKLSQLTGLYLAQNRLTTLPAEIGKLSRLRDLGVSKNQISTIPSEIGDLPQLIALNLCENQLTTLPPQIVNLSRLMGLHLNHNRLIFILNEGFFQLGDDQPLLEFQLMADKFDACSNYACRTPLAFLCQQIHLGQEDDSLRYTFELLPDEMQQRIREVWAAMPSSSSGSSEAGADLFADRASFAQAVITVLQGKWHSLSEGQQYQTYAQVAILAGLPGGNADWGQAHAEENIIRLIDAMELVS